MREVGDKGPGLISSGGTSGSDSGHYDVTWDGHHPGVSSRQVLVDRGNSSLSDTDEEIRRIRYLLTAYLSWNESEGEDLFLNRLTVCFFRSIPMINPRIRVAVVSCAANNCNPYPWGYHRKGPKETTVNQ